MKKFIDDNRTAILFFGVAFLIRLIYLFQIQSNPFFNEPIVDELWNVLWAKEIMGTSFWGTEAWFRGPLYPYFLALILKITGSDFFWARIIQLLISSGSVVLTYLLGRECFSEKTGRLAAFFHLIYGTLIFYEAMFLIPVIFVFLNLLALLVIVRNRDNPRKWPFFIAGLIFGLSAIARPNILLIAPLLAIWIFYRFRHKIEYRSIIIIIFLFFFGIGLPIAPVTARNYIVADDIILISSQGGINLYLGNNPRAEGLTMMMPEAVLDERIPWDQFIPTVTKIAERETGRTLKPSEVSGYWSNKARQFIFGEPVEFIKLTSRKLVYFFSGFENSDQTDIYDFRKYSSLLSILIFDYGLKFPFGLFAPLAIVGVGLSLGRRKPFTPLLIFMIGYIPTVILFLVTARHRLTIIPIMLLFSAFAVLYLWDNFRNLKKIIFPVLGIITFGFLLNINYFDIGFENKSQIHFNLALNHNRLGEYQESVIEYQLAIKEAPGNPALYFGLGTAYNSLNRYRDAVPQLNQAILIDPDYTEAYINLANSYIALGQLDRAQIALRRATNLEPNRVEIYINKGDMHMMQQELDKARQAFLKVLELEPENYAIYSKLGVIYGQAGDTGRSYGFFRQGIEINELYLPAYLNWGNICLINGDTTLAFIKYQQAILTDSLSPQPYYNMAILYYRQGNIQRCRSYLDRLLRITPDFQPALNLQSKLTN